MDPAMYFVILLSLMALHLSYYLTTSDKSTKYTVVKSNNEPACALDDPSVTVNTRSRLACSVSCAEYEYNCTSFNFKEDSQTCDLYTYDPECFVIVPSCRHFQSADRPVIQYSGIAAPECSFPFTFNGGLYYSCTPSVNETTGCTLLNHGVGCLVANRTWQTCASQLDYVAQNQTLSVSIPTQPPMLLPTVNGWIIFQQRINDTLDFNRVWADYKNGFGDVSQTGNYWLGLDRIHLLTTAGGRGSVRLRMEFQARQNLKWFSAEYDSFWVENETLKYQVEFSGFTGDAEDAFGWRYPPPSNPVYANGMKFSTLDQDTSNCAATRGGGWWYNSCMYVCLNCGYGFRFYYRPLVDLGLSGDPYLTASRMMIKNV